MGLGKFGIGLLCLVGGSVIGAGGYSVYTHHHENQETVRVSQKSSETKSLSSNKLNSESLQSESSESQNQVEFSSRSTNNINLRSSVAKETVSYITQVIILLPAIIIFMSYGIAAIRLHHI